MQLVRRIQSLLTNVEFNGQSNMPGDFAKFRRAGREMHARELPNLESRRRCPISLIGQPSLRLAGRHPSKIGHDPTSTRTTSQRPFN